MATISINPDADGDLHDASLHNDKFQTILNEINGNLDANNLANPNSFLVFNSFAGQSRDPLAANPVWSGWSLTNVVNDKATQSQLVSLTGLPSGIVDACNIMTHSQFQNTTGQAMTLHSGSFAYHRDTNYGNATIVLRAQRNTSVGDGWEDMATMSFNPNGALANISISAFGATPIVALPTGSFFRVLIQNNAATPLGVVAFSALTYASFTATFKVPHTN